MKSSRRKGKRTPWIRLFRGCAILGLILFLLLAGALFYFNQVGLPEFVKEPILSQLRSRGFEVQFDRLRFRLHRGLVADQLRLSGGTKQSPFKLQVGEASLGIDKSRLAKFELRITSIGIRDGELSLPVVDEQGELQALELENIQTRVRFGQQGDRWQLEQFEARCLGIRIHVSGSLTNASRWRVPDKTPVKRPIRGLQLHQLLRTASRLQFSSPPDLRIHLEADAFNPERSRWTATFSAPELRTPWGTAGPLSIQTRRTESEEETQADTELGRMEINFYTEHIEGTWGRVEKLDFHASGLPWDPSTQSIQWLGSIRLQTGAISNEWFQTRTGVQFQSSAKPFMGENETNQVWTSHNTLQINDWQTAHTKGETVTVALNGRHPSPDWTDWSGDALAQFSTVQSRFGTIRNLRGTWTIQRPDWPALRQAPEHWGPWKWLAPFQFSGTLSLDGIKSDELTLSVDTFHLVHEWDAPRFTIKTLESTLYGGSLHAGAHLNVEDRTIHARAKSDFDVHGLDPLLTPEARRWLSQYQWDQPPSATGSVSAQLPSWKVEDIDWKQEVLPTVELEASLQIGAGGFRGARFSRATSSVHLTNAIWHLPDLRIERPEGQITLDYTSHAITEDYHWKGRSSIDPSALKPLLETEKQVTALELFEWIEPPILEGEIWGRWHERERIGALATLQAGPFKFRGQSIDSLHAELHYTNLVITATNAVASRGTESGSIELARFIVPDRILQLTNGVGRMDPHAVAQMIGPKTTEALEPYRFGKPPRVTVNGTLQIGDPDRPDLHFTVEGEEFRWWRFRAPEVAAEIHWMDKTLVITNAAVSFYGGKATGHGVFDFTPQDYASFHFKTQVVDSRLKPLLDDVTQSSTNRVHGTLNGHLLISSARTDDWNRWDGQGRVTLEEGVIWDIPLFGVFSPILNAIYPGLGNSRADQGSASFTIRDGVIHTPNLEIRAPMMRMHYKGSVTFQGELDARMEASLLRDAWVVGRLFSLALTPLTKVFEYKVTGTLAHPETEPLYIPKFLLIPLKPFKTLQDLLNSESEPRERPAGSDRPNPSG